MKTVVGRGMGEAEMEIAVGWESSIRTLYRAHPAALVRHAHDVC